MVSNEDIFPLHKINHKGAIPVEIGNVKLGENPYDLKTKDGTQPNPIKITWSRTNNVKVHEVPYPKHKTIRTSKESLYRLSINFKTLRNEVFEKVLKLCEQTGPHWVKTSTLTPRWMYITDYTFDQNAGYDDDYIEWNLTLNEVND